MILSSRSTINFVQPLRLLHAGERVAESCAGMQATLAPNARIRRFLLYQARQERLHARLFRSTVDDLGLRCHDTRDPAMRALYRYQTRLQADLDRGQFVESLLGMQVVFEGLGEQILRHTAKAMARVKPLPRAFQLILSQEETHHEFGLHWLTRLSPMGVTESKSLYQAADDYIEIAYSLMEACRDLFAPLNTHPEDLLAELTPPLGHLIRSENPWCR